MKRGEIWWVEAPDIAPRPHLILTRDQAIPALHRLIAIPATRTIRDIPTEVRLGEADGMAHECVLSCDNVRVVNRAYFIEYLTTLGSNRLNAVCTALARATACS